MLGAINSLRILASQAFGAAGLALDPFKEARAAAPAGAGTTFADGLDEAYITAALASTPASLASVDEVTDALNDYAESLPSSEATYLDEIAGHLGAQTPLLEDIRNLLNASVAPGTTPPSPPVDAAEGPALAGTASLAGAGHLNQAHLCHVVARGLRHWVNGDECTQRNYWGSIATTVDAVGNSYEAIARITK